MGRIEAAEKGARQGGFIEDGETFVVAIPVNGGTFVNLGLDSFHTKRFMLCATERNFYVLSLGQVGFKSVKGVAAKLPIAETEVEVSFAEVKVHQRGAPDGEMKFGLALAVSAKKLKAYVDSQAAAG